IIENLRKSYHVIVDEVIQDGEEEPKKLSYGKLTRVLKELLREQVSIRNMRVILESLSDALEISDDPEKLAEFTRQALSRQICSGMVTRYENNEPVIDVISLSPETERLFTEIKGIDGKKFLTLS